jgi:hypothetical protein
LRAAFSSGPFTAPGLQSCAAMTVVVDVFAKAKPPTTGLRQKRQRKSRPASIWRQRRND